MTEVIIAEVVAGLTVGFCGYLMYKLKKLEEKLERAMSKEDIKEYVSLIVNPVKEEQVEIKKDLDELSKKIDANHEKTLEKLDRLLLSKD